MKSIVQALLGKRFCPWCDRHEGRDVMQLTWFERVTVGNTFKGEGPRWKEMIWEAALWIENHPPLWKIGYLHHWKHHQDLVAFEDWHDGLPWWKIR